MNEKITLKAKLRWRFYIRIFFIKLLWLFYPSKGQKNYERFLDNLEKDLSSYVKVYQV